MAAIPSRTAVLTGIKQIEIVERTCPPPPPGHAQIRVLAVGICGSDLAYWQYGVAAGKCAIPFPESTQTGYKGQLGHEAAGEVVAIGEGVASVKVGDIVALEGGIACRECFYCSTGRYNLCPKLTYLGSFIDARPGALTEFINHPASYCHVLPPHCSPEHGAMLEPLSVALSAVKRGTRKYESGGAGLLGTRVLITGAGPIGLLVMLCLRSAGIAFVAVVDVVASRLQTARDLGATETAHLKPDATAENFREAVGDNFDLTFECTGAPGAVAACIRLCRSGGCCVLVGNPKGPESTIPLQDAMRREIDLVGVHRYCNLYPVALQMVASGGIDLQPFLRTPAFSLSDTSAAFVAFSTGEPLKVIIKPAQ